MNVYIIINDNNKGLLYYYIIYYFKVLKSLRFLILLKAVKNYFSFIFIYNKYYILLEIQTASKLSPQKRDNKAIRGCLTAALSRVE